MLRHGESGDWYGTFAGHKGAVWSTCLNTPALLCATGSADFSARVWDACTGNQLHEFAHPHIVRTTSFAQSSDKLATGCHDKTIRIYDIGSPEAAPLTLPVSSSTIRSVAWLQDDNILISALSDTPGINVYDVRSLQLVSTLPTSAPVTSLDISYDRLHLTTAEGRIIRFFDASTLRLVKEQALKHNAEAASFCPIPGKRRFVAGGEDMWVHLYDYETGEEIEVNKGHHGPVHTLRFSPAYDAYASGSEDGTIRIWFPL